MWAVAVGGGGGGGATALTVVVADAALFVMSDSGSFAATVARLTSDPVADGRAVMVTVACAPAFRLPSAQCTGPRPSHVPWLGSARTSAAPAGRVSSTATPVAAADPSLRTTIE